MISISQLLVLIVGQADIGFFGCLGAEIAVMVDAALESYIHPDIDLVLILPIDAWAEGASINRAVWRGYAW